MKTYLVFLGEPRSGTSPLGAEALRKTLEYTGSEKVRVSANLRDAAFDGANPNRKMMEAQIRHELRYLAGVDAEVVVLAADEFLQLAAAHPLAAGASPENLYATLLGLEPAPLEVDTLLHTMNGVDEHELRGRFVYSHYRNGYASSRRSNDFIAKLLGVPAVTRTWAEVRALAALCEPGATAIAGR